MFERSKKIAKSYLQAKKNEYAGYAGMEQTETEYQMKSPKTMGDLSRQEAMYAGKGETGKTTAKAYGTISAIAEDVKTIKEINEDVEEEEEKKRAEKRRRRRSRGR